jgi:hypothetical protein
LSVQCAVGKAPARRRRFDARVARRDPARIEKATQSTRALSLLSPGAGRAVVNWFNLSLVGWVIVIVAVGIAAYRFGADPIWIAIGALLLLGVGIIASVKHSKPRI